MSEQEVPMQEAAPADTARENTDQAPPVGWPGVVLRIAGLAAALIAAAVVWYLQRDDPHLIVFSVPETALISYLAVVALLALVQAIVPNPALHVTALALLAVGAIGIRDLEGSRLVLGAMLLAFLLAAELPHGAARLRELRAAVPASAGATARRDLARYTLHYLAAAPFVLAIIAAVTVLALALPDLILGGFSQKYVEAMETRSAFFVVAVTWLLVAPLFLLRGLFEIRRRSQAEDRPRPVSPIATGASLLEANASLQNDAPIIEVTQ